MNFLHYGSAEVTVCRTIHAVNEVQKCCATIGFALEAARAWRRVEFELLSCKVSFAAANIGFKYIQILNKRTPLFVSCKSLARVLVCYVYDGTRSPGPRTPDRGYVSSAGPAAWVSLPYACLL